MNLFSSEIPNIQGLTYTPNYITAEQEQFLISQIDQQPWLSDLKRRVQHYGVINTITKPVKSPLT